MYPLKIPIRTPFVRLGFAVPEYYRLLLAVIPSSWVVLSHEMPDDKADTRDGSVY